MRKPKTYYATRGALTGEGKSKTEAKADLERQIDWACNHAASVAEWRFGLLLIVSASPNGWQHQIIDPTEMQHGKQVHATCLHGQIAYTDALLAARSHAAQNAWNADVADDAAFVEQASLNANKASELARWIKFQRGYIAAKAQGYNNAQAFNVANRMPA
jgi:hypothetical protein